MLHKTVLFVTFAVLVCCNSTLSAQQEENLSAQQTEIKQLTEQFVAAFNKGDAKTIAARWADKGQMNIDGEIVTGRDAIEADYAAFFAENAGLQISINIESIELLGPNAAIEKGISEIVNDEDDSLVDAYTLIYSKTASGWRIVKSEVQQTEVDLPDWRSELGGLIGKWQAADGDWRVETSFEWVPGGNFLKRSWQVFESNESVDSGIQIIGWDANSGNVKSWTFHKDGGHGEGIWSREGSQWVVNNQSTTTGGQFATSTNIFTIVSDNAMRWQSINRTLDGIGVADTDSIRITRVK